MATLSAFSPFHIHRNNDFVFFIFLFLSMFISNLNFSKEVEKLNHQVAVYSV